MIRSGYDYGPIITLSSLLQPFTELTKKNAPESAFFSQFSELLLLQEAVRTNVGTSLYDINLPLCLFTDACTTGIGGALVQPRFPENRKLGYRIIAVHSKKLNSTQLKWSTFEKECFAVVYYLGFWRVYCGSVFVEVYSDHQPLRWIFRQILSDKTNSRVSRWLITLMGFSLEVFLLSRKT